MPIHSYTWIFVVTLIFSLLDAYAIGTNDVANSFATSVGSRSLTLKQAVCIAFFTEFGGAVALGATTADTVKDNIININMFSSRPDLLMSGFMCALIASSAWVMIASTLGFPLSTTHSIIGALIGVGISAYGKDAVNWGWEGRGVAQIATSWVLAPCLAGVLAAAIYTITLFAVMNRRNSLRAGIWAVPFFFTSTSFIVSFYVFARNSRWGFLNEEGVHSSNIGLTFAITGAITGATLIFSVGFLVPFFIRRLEKEESLRWYHVFCIHWLPEQPHDTKIDTYLKRTFTPQLLNDDEKSDLGMPVEDEEEEEHKEERWEQQKLKHRSLVMRLAHHIKWLLMRTLYIDVASVQRRNKGAVRAHEVAILYDNKTEYLYSLLQVVTASFASFSHGSNDVAGSLGPLAGVYQLWETGTFSTYASIPYWMLVNAGLMIDLGLALYGYNIMRNLGNNITYHSPSRGFSMELGAALAVLTASFLALPVSTTQCIVGATVAVGLCNGKWRAINWGMVAIAGFGWVITLPVAGTAAGLLYAVLTRGPSFTLPPSQ
ncbi:unnamed protein product [Closterium sp. Naga37s-1]|nr:unnamed protein product [Closterium sp. Naga37s-1]